MKDFATTQQNMINDTNKIASNDILAIASVTDQRNMLALTSDLINKKISGTLTTEQQAQFDYVQTVWSKIQAIRTAAGVRKTAIAACTTLEQLIEA